MLKVPIFIIFIPSCNPQCIGTKWLYSSNSLWFIKKPVMLFYCALLSNHLRDFNKLSKLADCTRGLVVIYILHDIFYLSLTCRIIFNFMAIYSPNSSANLKLTKLLCKKKSVFVFSKCLKKTPKLPRSLCLYYQCALVELLFSWIQVASYTYVWGKTSYSKNLNS